MIGRAAMSAPWIFNQIKEYLASGLMVDAPSLSEKWNLVLRHCQLAVREWGAEEPAIRSMRAPPDGLFVDDAQCETVCVRTLHMCRRSPKLRRSRKKIF